MTRARRTANGVMTPPPLYRWIDAVLLLCVSLVQGAVSTLKMIVVRCTRECHTKAPHADLPQATNSISKTGPKPSTVILGLVPRIPVVQTRGTTSYSPEAVNQDARHKAEHDTVGVEPARPSLLSFRAKAQRAADLGERRRLGAIWSGGPNRGVNASAEAQGRWRILFRLAASISRTRQNRSWIPTFVGMSGDGCCN